MKTTEEMIEVMQAFVKGEGIEYKNYDGDTWIETIHPVWDWAFYDYRIKPKVCGL